MKLNELLKKTISFINVDIWRFRRDQFGKRTFILIGIARVCVLAARKYSQDNCKDKASALTYYSILSIVPLAAMAFGMAKAFGFDDTLTQSLYEMFRGHETIAEYLLEFSDTYLASTKGGLVAGVGFAMLLYSVMNLLGHAESAFNHIWETKRSRSMVRKFSDYISIVLIAVIAISAYSSLMVNVTDIIGDSGVLGQVWQAIKMFAPCFLVWIGLSLIYFILPNTKVNFGAAFLGAFIAGTALMIVQFCYLYFQIGMSKNNAIYGSFAAIPLFLIWMQTTWHLVMLGSEIAFAAQNAKSYAYDSETSHFSFALRRKISLFIAAYITKRFANCEPAPSAATISVDLHLPLQIVFSILFEQIDAGLMNEVRNDQTSEPGYQPAFDISQLTVARFMASLEQRGDTEYDLATEDFEKLAQLVDAQTVKAGETEFAQMLVKDL